MWKKKKKFSKTLLNVEHKLCMNNQVSDTDSDEPLVFLLKLTRSVSGWSLFNFFYKKNVK